MGRYKACFVVATVALCLGLVGCKKDHGPTGQAVGSMVKSSPEFVQLQRDLWGAMAEYKEPYLKDFSEQLESMPDDPITLLKAIDELMYEITGPSGLWRSHVPRHYFGCAENHDLPICQQIESLEMSFLPWETLHVQVSTIKTHDAAEDFLTQFEPKFQQYMDYYVPRDKSLSSVQATPFFKQRLSIFLPE